MNQDCEVVTVTDYEQTLAYFHALHDVRFKLLGFLPIATGTAIALVPTGMQGSNQLALAIIGLMVTLGLASYDQRNTQIYDRLICRVRYLERKFGFAPFPGDTYGGAFHCRPPVLTVCKMRLVWHIQGLTLVYAASMSGWWFLGLSAIVSCTWLLALTTTAFFVGCYTVLRLISSYHHRETKAIAARIGGMEG